jgi:hypothetical protein
MCSLTIAPDGGECSASHHIYLNLEKHPLVQKRQENGSSYASTRIDELCGKCYTCYKELTEGMNSRITFKSTSLKAELSKFYTLYT